jgi:DNA-binding NarL/FixJ family response regulator
MQSASILVVEDFEPFRTLICSVLGQAPNLRVIGWESDGLQAVQRAEQLHPDLILLDIGLPTLNGLQVAKRIQKKAPNARVLFVSQELSEDVIEAALDSGGLGYVHKSQIHEELLSAIDEILAGHRFVSCSLTDVKRSETTPARAAHHHEIFFHSTDEVLLEALKRFIALRLVAGRPIVIAVTEPHRESLLRRLREERVPVRSAIQDRLCIWLDASKAPDSPVLYLDAVRGAVEAASTAARTRHSLALCGEGAGCLWAKGKAQEALQVERLCNDLAMTYQLDILCAYPSTQGVDESDRDVLDSICMEHSGIHT